jgi:signal peptidase II
LSDSDTQQGALRWIWLSVLIVALDQLSKFFVEPWLAGHPPVVVIPGFVNLVLVYNTGAAFSLLSSASGWQRWLFTGLAVVIGALIVFWLRKTPRGEWTAALPLAMILGGAVGNLIDRLRLGHVIDFVDVYYGGWHWPAFNVADSSISVGAVLFILAGLFRKK